MRFVLTALVGSCLALGFGPRAADGQAPALNTPPALPLDSAAYGANRFRITALLQVRGDFPENDPARWSSFFLRKAELGFRAHVAAHTDLLLELDPVRPADPFRRTYVRLSHLPRLHLKLGLEKAPLGLEELLSSARIPFVDRSAVTDRFAAAEEVGIHLDSRWDSWLLQFSVTNGGRRLLRDDNDHKDVSARAVWGPTPWISLGVAGLRGRTGPDEKERTRANAEIKLGSQESGIQAEFFNAEDGTVQSSAFYVAGFHALPLGRALLSHVQPVLRYEHLDQRDAVAGGELRLLTFGASLFLDGHRSKMQLNYLLDLRPGENQNELRAQYQVDF
jgi:hypothetical protein